MPDKPPEDPQNFSKAVRALLTTGLLTPFALKASESFADGHHVAGGVYAALVTLILLAGAYWPRIEALAARAGIAIKSKAKFAVVGLSGAAVVASAFIIGMYVGRRQAVTPAPIGHIVWNFEQTARGAGYFLTMQKLSDQPEIRVISFGARAKNVSDKPILQFNGTMRSEQTNVTVPLYLLAQEQDQAKAVAAACFPHAWLPTLAEQTFGIPPLAEFEISSSEKPFIESGKDGIPLSKFLHDFVPFTVSLEYDGVKYERRFTADEVRLQAEVFRKTYTPQSNPRITRKVDAKSAPLMPLETIIPQPLPKSLPGLASPIPPVGLPKIPFN
ncbi:hypothetical protein IVA95_07075 [Bradyrhizobium sp. 157]|uniref:hypothetical protein n=1 Tax=Bradyrhizobium sp. 157 TaxID=2782631 RepID=UPI001FF91508|nr:hypothetical protein [Bradyrhizobium sp. 157]MCK1637353.1 hypothetical protein [Bradyrhizobium sp. 157]